MRKPPKAIDGFVPRHSGRLLGDVTPSRRLGSTQGTAQIGQSSRPLRSGSSTSSKAVSRQEIDDSLKDIDDEVVEKPKRGLFGRKKDRQPISRRKKLTKRVIKIILIIALLVGAFVGIRAFIASTSIFKGNLFDFFQSRPLKEDANGRTNILILGSTDDDPNHPGNNLTDTIIVVSLDQDKKDAYMFSIPRDLWVQYDKACDAGYEGKINVYFSCAQAGTTDGDEQARLSKTQAFIGKITGLDIQYGVHVNSVVVRDAVNAVGGVDVDIQGSDGAPGILDRNFDGACHYQCYYVKYDNGVHHLDGAHAMYLSMARGERAPTYGLGRSNFDREVNQQKVLIALKNKAASAGTLLNVGKVTSLLDALGKNLRTNFATSEIQTLIKLGKDIPSDKIKRLSLIDGDNPVVTTGNVGGQSIVQPVAGLYDYSGIQSFIQKQITANAITKGAAHVALFNASGTEGYAGAQSTRLEKMGFTITATDNAPAGSYQSVEIYDLTGKKSKKPATRAKLEKTYGVKTSTKTPPITVSGDTDFIVIFGTASSTN